MTISAIAQRLAWRANRLRCMTHEEIGHRVLRALAVQAQRWGVLRSSAVPAPDLQHVPSPWVRVPHGVGAGPYLQAADRVAAGRFDVFELQGVKLGSPPPWNRDPKSGAQAPLIFGKLLSHRDPRVGDIKYLWELNRHLHLVTLAQAYALSGEAQYFGVIRRHLESWFEDCPYAMGPNWSSALELGIRLINWSVAWQLLGGASSPLFADAAGGRFRRRWLDSVYQHAQFVHGHFSLYSSANNHLIGEAAGLFIAALTWPCWPHAHKWRAQAKAILEREALLQNAPDGVNREQAVSYQQFGLDLLLLALLAGRANGNGFSPAYESRVEAMLDYLASIMDAGGNVPMIGDSDDAVVVNLAPGLEFCAYRSLLATGALLYRRADFKAKAGNLDDKTRWLLGQSADSAFDELAQAPVRLPVRRAFVDGGYYILGCDFETENEIRVLADAGPLGYQTIAAHGHADALAFTLSVGGREFFIDPGTYVYPPGPWRRYFRGSAAHNTLCVDGMDQSQPGGTFMWVRKAHARCNLWWHSEERDVFDAWHDGYTHLPDPVVHRRRLTLEKPTRRLLIEDTLRMSGEHEIELFFHCSEHCQVDPAPDGYALSQAGKTLILRLPRVAKASTQVYYGSMAPIRGWVSRRYGDKRPAPCIAWRARLAGEVLLRSEVVI